MGPGLCAAAVWGAEAKFQEFGSGRHTQPLFKITLCKLTLILTNMSECSELITSTSSAALPCHLCPHGVRATQGWAPSSCLQLPHDTPGQPSWRPADTCLGPDLLL